MSTEMVGEKSPETHEKFLQYLKESEDAVWFLARWFCANHDRTVMVHPSTQAKTHQEWKGHVDKGDLYMRQEGQPQFRRYEVKRLGANFTSAKDWPFGSKFIVCAQHAYDNASPPPASYFILSKDLRYMAVVRGSTKDRWKVEKRVDGRTQVEQSFYFCPIDEIVFYSLTEE